MTDIEQQRQEWEDVIDEVRNRREGWEVDTAVELVETAEIEVEGRSYEVSNVDPEIGFVEMRLHAGEERYFAELRWYENLGYSIEMRADNVEIPE